MRMLIWHGLAGMAGEVEVKSPQQQAAVAKDDWRSPVYSIIAANVAIFALVNCLHLLPFAAVQLQMKQAAWWQIITSCFGHASFDHLAETTFLIYTFGRLVEKSAGPWGLWATYLLSAIGELMAMMMVSISLVCRLSEMCSVGVHAMDWMNLTSATTLAAILDFFARLQHTCKTSRHRHINAPI